MSALQGVDHFWCFVYLHRRYIWHGVLVVEQTNPVVRNHAERDDEIKQVILESFPWCHLRFVPIDRAVVCGILRSYYAPVFLRALLCKPLFAPHIASLLIPFLPLLHAIYTSLNFPSVSYLFATYPPLWPFFLSFTFVVTDGLFLGLSVSYCYAQVVSRLSLCLANSPRAKQLYNAPLSISYMFRPRPSFERLWQFTKIWSLDLLRLEFFQQSFFSPLSKYHFFCEPFLPTED